MKLRVVSFFDENWVPPILIGGALAVMLCLLIFPRPKYQSFAEAEQQQKVLKHTRWGVRLPYRSGKNVTIDLSQPAELLVYESGKDFHVVRIALNAKGAPEKTIYTKLSEGEQLHHLASGQLLVEAEKDNHAFVALLDPSTLKPFFSKELKYSDLSTSYGAGNSVSFGHWRQKGNVLIFYHNSIKIGRHSWNSADHEYSVPYVVDCRYDFHLLDLTTLEVRSFVGLTPADLRPLGSLLKAGKSEIIENGPLYFLPDFFEDRQDVPLHQYIYSLGKFFLVGDQKTLIFSLENEEGNTLYFSLDLRNPDAPPRWDLPKNFAALFPDELALTEAEKAERMKSQDIVVTDEHSDTLTYQPDQIELSPGGFVVVGCLKLGDDDYSKERSVAGVQIMEDGVMKQTWVYRLGHLYQLGPLLVDPAGQRLFFPDQGPEDRFRVVGLSAISGKEVSVFPANILLDRGNGDKAGRTLRIVGAAVDFQKGLIYIHDQKQNLILCADIDLSH
ncbi:MAG: hypothetical protein NTX17_07560 [Candidatus Eisenbacteria bacterium]|nr:hypothetical protein [Candidatus Eisenbacteria bacterium]